MKVDTILISVTVIGLSAIFLESCQNNAQPTDPTIDEALFSEISTNTGYTYYAGGNLLTPVSQSPHGQFKLRMNATAVSGLDANGKLPAGGAFPAGSVLVKEVYTGGNHSLYAVMKKDPANPNSESGWLWAEFDLNGAVVITTTQRGAACISCHSESPNRDKVRTFDFH